MIEGNKEIQDTAKKKKWVREGNSSKDTENVGGIGTQGFESATNEGI